MSSEKYQRLIVNMGETTVEGKSHWKDFVQVHIKDHKEAFKLAMDILRQVEGHQYSDDKPPVSISLTGTLEPED